MTTCAFANDIDNWGGTHLVIGVEKRAMVGSAAYCFKFRKLKADTKGSVDMCDYDFGVDAADDYEYESDDANEQEERGKVK